MGIPDEDVAQVRAATDLVALIGEHVALRHQGRRWVGLCPFHEEKTPSFSVNAEEGLYYCFGCQKSGDAITFARETEHLDFAEAVRWLAERAGVTIREDDATGADQHRRRELYEAVEQATAWYHERLLRASDAGAARHYLRSRGYDGDVVRMFRLGWAPDGWDELASSSGIGRRPLTESGLAFVNRRGRLQDAFRSRVIFPICDPSNRPIALGGRIIPLEGPEQTQALSGPPGPKYKNSPESPIYQKRRTLYGLNWAKSEVVSTNEVVVCEGYTDVIGCFQAGVRSAVATCGTALGEDHFRLLRNFSRRVILAYDSDVAGQSATTRVYEWERSHDVDVAVAALPSGTDPAELAFREPEDLRRTIKEARPFLRFRVDRQLEAADLTSAEGRARAADAALTAVAEHPDAMVRDQYVMSIADRVVVEPDRLRERLEQLRAMPESERPGKVASGRGPSKGPRERTRRSSTASQGRAADRRSSAHANNGFASRSRRPRRESEPSAKAGLEALRFMVHHRDAIEGRLHEALFGDVGQRRAYRALVESPSLHQAVDNGDLELRELLSRLAVEEPTVVGPLEGHVDAVVLQLVRLATMRALAEELSRGRASETEVATLSATTAPVRLWLEELDQSETPHEASDSLVAWLVSRRQEGE